MHTIDSTKKLYNDIQKANSAVIIGAGAIGLETASSLKSKEIDVSVVEAMEKIFPNALDSDIAEQLKAKLEEQGIKFYLTRSVQRISRKYVTLEGGKQIKAEIVIMAAGARPNIDFVKDSGILADKGIIINNQMQTNIPDIYAAGDVVQTKSMINGKPFRLKIRSTISLLARSFIPIQS